jgi:hypothetical protein
LGDLSDAQKYTSLYAGLDTWTVEDGEIVDYDPASGGPELSTYQSLVSNGYDRRR